MTLRMVDCNGLGGGMLVGMWQNGIELAYRCGDLSLGAPTVEANRHLLGWEWTSKFSRNPDEWAIPNDIDIVSGSPPCAGFSTMSSKEFRGMDSKANDHMKRFVRYVGRAAPTVAIFESVQQAFSQGRPLMTRFRDEIEAATGHKYALYHVLHNNASVGGAALRARYFWMVSRIPFGVEYPVPDKVPTLMESIGDLQRLDMTWERQPYKVPDTWWSSRRRSPAGVVDGHITKGKIHDRRVRELLHWIDYEMTPGQRLQDALLKCYQRYGKLPPSWSDAEQSIIKKKFELGFNQSKRWRGDKPAYVLTGAALEQAIHPTEPRTFTYREAMRIQGMPDDWRLWPVRNYKPLAITPGKGVPVDASRWVGHWISESFAGRPGSMQGVPDRGYDREYVMQVDKGYKMALARGGYRVHELQRLEGVLV